MSIHQLWMTDFDRDFRQLKISHIGKSYFARYLFLGSLGKWSGLLILSVFSSSSSLVEDIRLAWSTAALASGSAHVGAVVFFDSYHVAGVLKGHLMGFFADIVVVLPAEVFVGLAFEPVGNVSAYLAKWEEGYDGWIII